MKKIEDILQVELENSQRNLEYFLDEVKKYEQYVVDFQASAEEYKERRDKIAYLIESLRVLEQ